jgi:hypothetical protein
LDDKASARKEFVTLLRNLANRTAADNEDGSSTFFKIDSEDLFKRLNIPPAQVDRTLPKGRALALSSDTSIQPMGQAVGFMDTLKGAAAAAANAASYLSYYMMKERASTVGMKGVAPLLDKLAPKLARIHLIGHSFGGRLVTATALACGNGKLHSLCLLQAAFSHNGFSPRNLFNGFFRDVLEKEKIKNVIFATHTKNDTAVGIAYPLASRISGAVASALGDEDDKFGGIGRNGAQQMGEGERVMAHLLEVGGKYEFARGKIFNLEASLFIANHGDVTGPQVAEAIVAAAN